MAWTPPVTITAGNDLTATLWNRDVRDNLKAIGDAWTAYTPSWTGSGSNPAIGNGTIAGAYIQPGKLVVGRARIVMGSTTTFGSGNYSLSLPVAMVSGGILQASIQYIDGGSLYYHGAPFLESGTTFRLGLVSNAVANISSVSPTSPFTFANTDEIRVAFAYEAA